MFIKLDSLGGKIRSGPVPGGAGGKNTGWLSYEGIKSATVFNKMKPEDIGTVRKHKDILAEEVAKNGSLVDQWLRDKVNPSTWRKNETLFPEGKKCLSQRVDATAG